MGIDRIIASQGGRGPLRREESKEKKTAMDWGTLRLPCLEAVRTRCHPIMGDGSSNISIAISHNPALRAREGLTDVTSD